MNRERLIDSLASEMWDLVKEYRHRGMYQTHDWAWCVANLPREAEGLRARVEGALSRCGSQSDEKTSSLDLRLKEALIRGNT